MQVSLNLQSLLKLSFDLFLLVLNLITLHLLHTLALAHGLFLSAVASLASLAFLLVFARLSTLLLLLFSLKADALHLGADLAIDLLLDRRVATLLALGETRRAQLSIELGSGAIRRADVLGRFIDDYHSSDILVKVERTHAVCDGGGSEAHMLLTSFLLLFFSFSVADKKLIVVLRSRLVRLLLLVFLLFIFAIAVDSDLLIIEAAGQLFVRVSHVDAIVALATGIFGDLPADPTHFRSTTTLHAVCSQE